MRKTVAYARYSSDNQREESIEAQLRAIREYCDKNNIQLVKIYTDEAKSATMDNRPGFLQMLNDSKFGNFDLVIVHKLDRFARNRYDSAFYKRELKKNGVQIVSVTENLDDSPESIILESVLEGMAEYYSRNLAREVMNGIKETAYQCKHTGGRPPLGYDVGADQRYIVNEQEARAVRLIFELYTSGTGLKTIAKTLNEKGYRSKMGKLFGKNSIYDIIRNEKYSGVYVFNRSASKNSEGKRNHHNSKDDAEIIRIEGGMPAIVDRETFARAQERMCKNRRGQNKAKVIYLLSGIIYCGKCGGSMVGNTRTAGRNKEKYSAYECSARKRIGNCDIKSVGKEFIEDIVIDELESTMLSDKGITTIAKKVHDYAIETSSSFEEEIKELEKEKNAVQRQLIISLKLLPVA